MKKKNGFTLIELLAIIVILAIIAVITVPIILNIIEKAKQGAATNSALGYKDAIQKFYTSELFSNSNINLDGTYTVEDGNLSGVFNGTSTETKEIPLSGTAPASGSLVFEKSILKSGCIVVGEYAVTFEDGKAKETEKGTCENGALLAAGNTKSENSNKKGGSNTESEEKPEETKPATIILTKDNDKDEKPSTGDYVKIGNDGFYVLNPPANGKVLLIAEYNLDENSRQSATNPLNIYFSKSFDNSRCTGGCSYWWDYYAQALKSEYAPGLDTIFAENYGYDAELTRNIAYIYRDKNGNETPNNLKQYINNYKDYLSNTAEIEDARLISYEEVVMAGCGRDKNANPGVCPDWMGNQDYWTGSQIDGWDYILYMYSGNKRLSRGQITSFKFGIRPIVVVQSSLIGR